MLTQRTELDFKGQNIFVGQFTLFTEEKEMPENVSIYNSKGQKIKQFDKISSLEFNMLNETPGLYVVRVTWHNKDASQKFIIR